jgi:hypothetical protein
MRGDARGAHRRFTTGEQCSRGRESMKAKIDTSCARDSNFFRLQGHLLAHVSCTVELRPFLPMNGDALLVRSRGISRIDPEIGDCHKAVRVEQ